MPGVGPATAARMYAMFGDEILKTLDSKDAAKLLLKVCVGPIHATLSLAGCLWARGRGLG